MTDRVPEKDLIEAWIRYKKSGSKSDFWAVDHVNLETAGRAPARDAWSMVLALLAIVPDEHLGDVAAGPLENLVTHYAAELIDLIEVQSRRDRRFREALGRVWITAGVLNATLERRVIQASNGAIRPLPNADGRHRPA